MKTTREGRATLRARLVEDGNPIKCFATDLLDDLDEALADKALAHMERDEAVRALEAIASGGVALDSGATTDEAWGACRTIAERAIAKIRGAK